MALNERTILLGYIFTARSSGVGRDPYEEQTARNMMKIIAAEDPSMQPLLGSMDERVSQIKESAYFDQTQGAKSGELQLGKDQILLSSSEPTV